MKIKNRKKTNRKRTNKIIKNRERTNRKRTNRKRTNRKKTNRKRRNKYYLSGGSDKRPRMNIEDTNMRKLRKLYTQFLNSKPSLKEALKTLYVVLEQSEQIEGMTAMIAKIDLSIFDAPFFIHDGEEVTLRSEAKNPKLPEQVRSNIKLLIEVAEKTAAGEKVPVNTEMKGVPFMFKAEDSEKISEIQRRIKFFRMGRKVSPKEHVDEYKHQMVPAAISPETVMENKIDQQNNSLILDLLIKNNYGSKKDLKEILSLCTDKDGQLNLEYLEQRLETHATKADIDRAKFKDHIAQIKKMKERMYKEKKRKMKIWKAKQMQEEVTQQFYEEHDEEEKQLPAVEREKAERRKREVAKAEADAKRAEAEAAALAAAEAEAAAKAEADAKRAEADAQEKKNENILTC